MWTSLIFEPMIEMYSMYYHGKHLLESTNYCGQAAHPNCVDLPSSIFTGSVLFPLQVCAHLVNVYQTIQNEALSWYSRLLINEVPPNHYAYDPENHLISN